MFDRWSFKEEYEAQVNRTHDPIDEKHLDTHFYTPKIYGFYEPAERKGSYRLSLLAKSLCPLLNDPTRVNDYRAMLGNILLNNEDKGDLFKEFISFVTKRKTRAEIYDRFPSITARTLIAWSREAGLMDSDEGENLFWAVFHSRPKPTQEAFLKTLLTVNGEMQKSETFGIRRIYVPVGELRANVCSRLGLDRREFDDELKRLLSTEYGKRFSFYGATTDVFKTKGTFIYRGKLYVYLSIK